MAAPSNKPKCVKAAVVQAGREEFRIYLDAAVEVPGPDRAP